MAAETPAASSAVGSPAAANDPLGALANLTSYKMKYVMSGKGTTSGIAAMGDISLDGTFITKPSPAVDVTMSIGSGTTAMTVRIVEINGKQYVDLGTGTLTPSTDTSQTSLLDSMSPQKMLGGFSSYIGQMKTVGDEQKNGIATTHLQATPELLATAGSSLSMLGLTGATWTWDVWLAKDGGYAVSYAMGGTGTDGATMSITLDLSDVNSPSNVVKGP